MSDSEEKSLDASEKKLRDARQKGQTASFRDLSAALGFVAGAGVIAVAAGGVVDALTTAQSYALSGMDRPFLAVFPSILAGLFGGLMLPFLAMLGAQVLAVTVGAIAAHKGFVFSLEPIALKLTNLDPIKGLGRIFGVRGVVEFCKSVVKVAVLMAAMAAFAVGTIGTLPHLVACGFDCTLTAIGAVFWPLFALFSVFLIVTGVFDVPIQTFLFNREMKMGQSEMKRERKDTDGTPEIKAEQRRLRDELAEASGRRPTASTDPTIAIAGRDCVLFLCYHRLNCPVPVILRKGRRKDAAEMIEIGKRLDLPAVVNDVIAQHLMKAVSEGETIDTYSFPAVAQAIYLAETQWDSMKG